MAKKKTKQEKLLAKEEAKRQKRLNKAKNKQYDGGFLGRCLALLIGFVLGFVSTIGGIVGGGYYLVSKPTVKQLSSLGGDGFDLSEYISDEYTNVSLLTFFSSFGTIANKVKDGNASIATLAEISPVVLQLTDKLTEALAEFHVDIDKDELTNLPFSQYSTFLTETLQTTPIGPIIDAKPDNSLMGLLLYGEEGVHYVLAEDGVTIKEWIGDAHALTIGDLMDTDSTADVLGRISLKAVMDSTGSTDYTDGITSSLLFGTKDVDFRVITDGETETIEMLPVKYTYELDKLTDDHDNEIPSGSYYATVVDGCNVIAVMKTSKARLVKEGTGANVEYYLLYNEDGNYYAYTTQDDLIKAIGGDLSGRVYHKARSINDLTSGDFTSILNDIQVASLLGVTATSSEIFLTLAYGIKGTDYEIVDGEIKMIDKAKPKTIGDLLGGEPMDMLKDVELASLLEVTADSSELLLTLAYGTKGTDYEIVDGKIQMIGDAKTKTIGDLLEGEPMDMLNGMELASLLDVTADSSELLLTLAYGTKGTDYTIVDGKIQMIDGAKPKTLGDLLDGEPMDILDGMELASLLDVTADSSELLLTLAYGTKGTDYTIVDGKIEMIDGAKPKTLGDLLEGEPMDMLNGMELASLLDVTADSSELLLTLAYGTRGTDYEIVDGKIQMIGDAKPKTLGDLLEGDTTEIINGMAIADLMGVTATSDELIRYLAYGVKDVDYSIIEGEIKMLTLSYTYTQNTETGIYELKDDHDSVIETTAYRYDETLGVFALLDGTEVKYYLVKDDADGKYYAYATQEDVVTSNRVYHKAKTIGDLIDGNFEIGELKIGDIVAPGEDKLLNALKDTKINEIGSKINTLTLGDILDINESSSKILISLKDTKINEIGSTLDTLQLNQIITIDESNKILSALHDATLSNIGERAQALTLKDVIAIPTDDVLLNSLKDTQINQIGSKVNTLTLEQIITIDESNKILYALKGSTISSIGDDAQNLKLGDVISITDTSSSLLKSLADKKISELGTEINKLTIGEIVDVEGSKFLKPLENTTIENLSDAIDALTLTEVFGDEIYEKDEEGNNVKNEEGNNVLKGEWKYLLTDPSGEKKPENYTISDMTTLVGNMTANIKQASVRTLNEDLKLELAEGFIGMDLLPVVKTQAGIEGDDKTHIGDLNLTEVSNYIVALSSHYSALIH